MTEYREVMIVHKKYLFYLFIKSFLLQKLHYIYKQLIHISYSHHILQHISFF